MTTEGLTVVDLRVPVAPETSLHVRQWPGEPDRRAFLLVHGLSSNARLWDEVAAHLTGRGHAAYAVDLRSHGESDSPPGGYDTVTAATDLATVADGLGLRGLVVAGQSWGGSVTVRLAATRPDLVAALALVDGGWSDLRGQFGSWEECAAALRPPDLDGQRADNLQGYLRRAHPGWSAGAIEATLASLRIRADGTMERRLSIEHHMEILRSMWDDPPRPFYPLVTAPTLLIPALAKDPAGAQRRREVVEAAAAELHGTVREYVGGDHDLHAQHPRELANDLLTLAEATA